MIAGKAAGMGKSARKPVERPVGPIRKPTAQSADQEVPVDKALPGITSQVEYPSLQAASNKSQANGGSPGSVAAEAEISIDSSEKAVATQTVAAIAEKIQTKVETMKGQREQLKRGVEACLTGALAGNTIEVVGSSSWGGEVPQSDLDLVLVTPCRKTEPSQALALLQALEKNLESQTEGERVWTRLELVEARKVPLLRLYDRAGLSCDVVVDQMHALEHRKLLVEALEGRPETKTFIRLVKYWLRQRGLPMGSEGGLPSFAWAYSALQLALQLPRESTVERLLFHFFKQMNLLSSMSLLVQKTTDGGSRVAWKSRKDPYPWAQEWIEFIWVDDPTRQAAKQPGMTPQMIPSSLAALYACELRLAFRAIQEAKWDDLWLSTADAKLSLKPAAKSFAKTAPLHLFLKQGELVVGKLEKVLRLPNTQHQELHRRDQSSELQIRRCSLSKDPRSDTTKCFLTQKILCFKPCNWVCALPIWNMTVKAGLAQTRLNELALLAENWRPKPQSTTPNPSAQGYMVPVLTPSVVMLGGYPVGVYVMHMGNAGGPVNENMKVPGRVQRNPWGTTQQPKAVTAAPHVPVVPDVPVAESQTPEKAPEAEEAVFVPAEKAGSDDSTRASDSEEFTPVPKKAAARKKARLPVPAPGPEVPEVNRHTAVEESSLGMSEVDHPFATSLALNLDVPRRLAEGLPPKPVLSMRLLNRFNGRF